MVIRNSCSLFVLVGFSLSAGCALFETIEDPTLVTDGATESEIGADSGLTADSRQPDSNNDDAAADSSVDMEDTGIPDIPDTADSGQDALTDSAEKLFFNTSRLGVSFEAASAKAGDKPSSDFVLSGACVKLW